jgi:hypothetical protein
MILNIHSIEIFPENEQKKINDTNESKEDEMNPSLL